MGKEVAQNGPHDAFVVYPHSLTERVLLEVVHDSRGRVIGFTETYQHMTEVYAADTKYVGYCDGANVYDAFGMKVADSPNAIGVLLRGE